MRLVLLRCSLVSIAALAAGTAQAQQAPAAAAGPDVSDDADIVVTGSRIARRDTIANSPIATIGTESFDRTGVATLETALVQLPQFTASTGSTTNSNANGGQANIQLRGLGRQRTLVLLDGRRLIAANPDGSVDINAIPSAMIGDVEVITGGASAVYGSDAVAGVVNFKLRKSFSGFELSAQNGITSRGDGGDRKIALIAGTGFADGRGHVVVSGEYAQRDAIHIADRAWTFGANRAAASPYGAVSFAATNQPSQAALDAVFAGYGVAPGTVARGNTIGFNADGTLYSTGLAVANYRGDTDPNFAVNNGRSLVFDDRRFRYLQLPLERYSGFGRASFDVSPGLSLFLQGFFTRTKTQTSLNPSPIAGSNGISAVPVTNPFIPEDFRTLLASRPNPAGTFNVDVRTDVVGPRVSARVYDTYQIIAGAEGQTGLGDWTYSVTGTYGRNDIQSYAYNFVSRTRVNQLLRAADGGNSLCEGGYNPFGVNRISASCAAYISPRLSSPTYLEQEIIEAGAQGGLFDLPGGQVRAALGAGYRRDKYATTADPLLQANDIIFGSGQTFSGSIGVKEFYGEISLPILRDMTFFHALNIDLAYRYSDYNTVGGVHTYKADGYWEPARGVRFRSGYERAVRAPNIGEVFQPQAFGSTIIGLAGSIGSGDPCDVSGGYRQGANAAQVRSLCLAQGVPTSLIDNFTFAQQSVNIISGGNPALNEEVADTYTAGIVLTPRFGTPLLGNFSLSVDFYSIDVRDAVGSVTANVALARCFNADGFSNPTYSDSSPFCSLVLRDANNGTIFQVQQLLFNLGGYRTSGIDAQASWQTSLGNIGTLGFNLVGSYLRSFKVQTLPTDPFIDFAGTIGNGQIDPVAISRPKYKGIFTLTYALGGFNAAAQWRYIGKMKNAANVPNGGTAPGVPSVSYFDLNIGYQLSDRLNIWGNVSNLTDRKPPAYPSQGSTDFATYDVLGRRFTMGLRARF